MTTSLTIKQGATFRKKWTWCSGADVVKDIAALDRSYPTVLTVTAHGLPTGPVPVSILDVVGEFSASAALADRIIATKLTADTFSVDIDSTEFAAYSAGGVLVYTPPVDLTAYTGRAQFRRNVGSATKLLDLDDGDLGGVTLGDTEGTVELVLTSAQTAGLGASSMEFDVEVISGTGEVTRLVRGSALLDKEVSHANPD